MVIVNNCFMCKNYNFENSSCKHYPKKIPKDIFLEKIECDYYQLADLDEHNNCDKPVMEKVDNRCVIHDPDKE